MAPFRGRGGFRGGSAAPRGRGGGGRGGRGRGGRGARGGGSGRGRATGRPQESRPLNDVEHPSSASESEQFTDESDQSNDSDTDDEENQDDVSDLQPASQAYLALLRSYQSRGVATGDRPRKRLKIEHTSAALDEENVEEAADQIADEAEEADDNDAEMEDANNVSDIEDSHDLADNAVSDPFVHHFADPDENELSARLRAISNNEWTTKRPNTKGDKCQLQLPSVEGGDRPWPAMTSTRAVNLKPRLVEHASAILGEFSEMERAVTPSLFNYQDILLGARTVQNASRLRHIVCLHALNHVFKTRDRVIKNNAKIAAQSQNDDVEYRDQGFTRPKILFLLETKQACVRAVQAITDLCDFEQQENKKRFLDNFSGDEDKFAPDRPDDFRELFEGNDENEFRIGLKFTRKTLKLFSKFYNSDIIFASALGLRRAIESGDPKKKDSDFLSSIEMVIMEQADATVMQNWEHAEYVFSHLNLQPKDAHGCDFSRVRSWYLDGHAASLRQTIILSAYLTPQITALSNRYMKNVAGRLKYTGDCTNGIIESLTYGNIKQTFTRFISQTPPSDPDARFKFFHSAILPQVTRLAESTPHDSSGGAGILIYIPSYLDFVRVRNSLVDSNFSYASISEYTDATDVRKARSHFMSGRHSVLLYTGRAHHFHRYNIRAVKRVVFYGVPENPSHYDEVVGFIGKTLERAEAERREVWVKCAFSKWEIQALERIVGSKRVGKMINDRGDTFDFV